MTNNDVRRDNPVSPLEYHLSDRYFELADWWEDRGNTDLSDHYWMLAVRCENASGIEDHTNND